MAHTDSGHIYAPVSTDDVAAVLGVSSHDVATLCTHESINPYSLIRPLYTPYPGFAPEDFENAAVGEWPTIDEFPNVHYAQGKWGFWVPYASSLPDLWDCCEIPWLRHLADEEDSWKSLEQFDGYRHNAYPTLGVSAHIVAEENIVVNLFPGNAQTNIIGDPNQGGVVALPEVLGDVIIGCTIFQGSKSNILGSFMGNSPIATSGFGQIKTIETTIKAQANRSYVVIPWAVENGKGIKDGKIIAGSKFFTLLYSDEMIADGFPGYISKTTENAIVYIGNVEMTKTASEVRFTIYIKNNLTTAQTVKYFYLHASWVVNNRTERKSVPLSGIEGISYITVAAKSSGSIVMSTNDSDIFNNYGIISSMYISAYWKEYDDLQSPLIGGPQTGGFWNVIE